MSDSTDAAILGEADSPSVIVGPGGERYHGWKSTSGPMKCLPVGDTLAILAKEFCA